MIVGYSLDDEVWVLASCIVVMFMSSLVILQNNGDRVKTVVGAGLMTAVTYVTWGAFKWGKPGFVLEEFFLAIFLEIFVLAVCNIVCGFLLSTLLPSEKKFRRFFFLMPILIHGLLTAYLVVMVTNGFRDGDATKNELVFQITNYVLAFLLGTIFGILADCRKNE